jgi:hypothetical protein
MPNEMGDHINLMMRSCWTFLTVFWGLSKRLCKLAQEEGIGLATVLKAV